MTWASLALASLPLLDEGWAISDLAQVCFFLPDMQVPQSASILTHNLHKCLGRYDGQNWGVYLLYIMLFQQTTPINGVWFNVVWLNPDLNNQLSLESWVFSNTVILCQLLYHLMPDFYCFGGVRWSGWVGWLSELGGTPDSWHGRSVLPQVWGWCVVGAGWPGLRTEDVKVMYGASINSHKGFADYSLNLTIE